MKIRKILCIFALKKLIVSFLIFALLFHQQNANAFVPPVANFVVNRAVAGILTRVVIARGLNAADPAIAATLVGAGTAISAVNVASTVAGVGLTIAGAPVWLTVVAGLGVFAIGA